MVCCLRRASFARVTWVLWSNGNRSRESVGNAHLVTGPATSGVAWGQAEAGRSWGTAWPAMLAVQTSAR